MVLKRLPQAAVAAVFTCPAMLAASLAFITLLLASAGSAKASMLPPANPRYSVPAGRYGPLSCPNARDVSVRCVRQSLATINAGRRSEDLGPLILPTNWHVLNVAQQLFVLTELERTARGLAADTGMAADLNRSAVAGAAAGRDPVQSAQRPYGSGSVWAGGQPNAIMVMTDWIYEDGVFASGVSENLNCSASSTAGCWQHRDILLHDGSLRGLCQAHCQIGAGYSPSGYTPGIAAGLGSNSFAEVLARSRAAQTFAWAREIPYLPACERTGDTCDWTGSPVATASGIVVVGVHRSVPVKPVSKRPTKPWFTLSVGGRNKRGHLRLAIKVGIELTEVTVVARPTTARRTAVAHRKLKQQPLAVTRLSAESYSASGTLSSGTWIVTIVYRTKTREAISHLRVTV